MFDLKFTLSDVTSFLPDNLSGLYAKGFPIFYFPIGRLFYLRDICFDFLYFYFLIVWKDLRELLLALVIFPLQQKTNKQTNKQINKKEKTL